MKPNKLLVFSMLMVCQLICCLALSIIAPFFPPFAKDKGISEVIVGIIFSANPVGAIIATLILGKILTEHNRFKFMISSLILQALGLFLFAVTKFEDNKIDIIATAIAARLINGFATSCFMTPLYAYIPVLFPDSIEQKISVAEIFAALGYLLGPVFGSIVFSIGGYLAPFVFIGCLALVLVPIIGIFFSRLDLRSQRTIDMVDEAKDSTESERASAEIKQILYSSVNENTLVGVPVQDLDSIPLDYLSVLEIYPIFMTSVSGFMVNFMFNFLAPIYADNYEQVYGASPETIGYYLCVMPATYSVTSLIMGYIKTGKTKYVMIGGFVVAITSFFAGPDPTLTHLDHRLYFILTAVGIMGIGAAPMVIYNVPLLNDYLTTNYPNQPTQCANMASALFNTSTFLGELIAPIVSGLLVKYYSFDTACSVLGGIFLVQAILFIPVLKFKIKEGSILHRSILKNKISIII